MIDDNKIKVNQGESDIRLDAYLASISAYKSRSVAAKFCDMNKVCVNGSPQSKKYKIQANDEICWEPAIEDDDIVGENIKLDVRYEDDDIIVLSKQANLVCHPAQGHLNGTLVNALVYRFGKENLCNIQEDNKRLGIVHRLDADTSGLMICAKTNKAGEILSSAMKDYSTDRHYKALVYGHVKHDSGKINVPLLRVLNKRPKMIASNDPKAKSAITSFEVIKKYDSEYGKFSLLDCKIHTGRTHQIRSHMEYINHPVVGDPLYNASAPKDVDVAAELNLNRQFLHSYKIGFTHPITNKYMEFEDVLPKDLEDVLNHIEEKA